MFFYPALKKWSISSVIGFSGHQPNVDVAATVRTQRERERERQREREPQRPVRMTENDGNDGPNSTLVDTEI